MTPIRMLPLAILLCGLMATAQRGTIVVPAGDSLRVPAGLQICADTIVVHGTLFCDQYDCLCRPIVVHCPGTCIPGGVPVELLALTAQYAHGVVFIRWTTATEKNNAGFEVQRESGNGWIVLDFVPGYGTVHRERRYEFRDPVGEMLPLPRLRYRLRQIDYDGTGNYSPEMEIRVTDAVAEVRFHRPYPNPSSGEVTVGFTLPAEMPVRLVLYDPLGREFLRLLDRETRREGYHVLRFDASRMNPGIYFIDFTAGQTHAVSHIVIRGHGM